MRMPVTKLIVCEQRKTAAILGDLAKIDREATMRKKKQIRALFRIVASPFINFSHLMEVISSTSNTV